MFTGNHQTTSDEFESYAVAAVRAFLSGYGSSSRVTTKAPALSRSRNEVAVQRTEIDLLELPIRRSHLTASGRDETVSE